MLISFKDCPHCKETLTIYTITHTESVYISEVHCPICYGHLSGPRQSLKTYKLIPTSKNRYSKEYFDSSFLEERNIESHFHLPENETIQDEKSKCTIVEKSAIPQRNKPSRIPDGEAEQIIGRSIQQCISNPQELICSRCGSALELRRSKYNTHFFGCTNFPHCRYTRNIK